MFCCSLYVAVNVGQNVFHCSCIWSLNITHLTIVFVRISKRCNRSILEVLKPCSALSNYVPLPKKGGGGGHTAFGADPVGVGVLVTSCLHSKS